MNLRACGHGGLENSGFPDKYPGTQINIIILIKKCGFDVFDVLIVL